MVLVAGDGVPHKELETLAKVDERQAMAASEGEEAVDQICVLQGEALGRDTIRGLEGRREGEPFV